MITFSLPFPESVNAIYSSMPRSGRVYLAPKAKEYKLKVEAIVKQMIQNGELPKLGKARLAVQYVFNEPDASRSRDVANYEKILTDGIQAGKLFDDDSQIDDNRQTRGPVDPFGVGRVDVFIEIIEGQIA